MATAAKKKFPEKATVMFEGEEMKINPAPRGHTLTPEELEKLSAGETIAIDCVTKKGKKYKAKGKLGWAEDYGNTFTDPETGEEKDWFGFQLIEDPFFITGVFQGEGPQKGKEVKFFRNAFGHDLTKEEADTLLAGDDISFEAYSAAKKKNWTCTGGLGEDKKTGKFGFVPDFARK